MKRRQDRSERSWESKSSLIFCLLWVFAGLTVLLALFRLFGLDWFDSTLSFEDPPIVVQKIIKGVLKGVELFFVYKILTGRGFFVCLGLSVAHVIGVGCLPIGWQQSLADAFCMFSFPFLSRKSDRAFALLETTVLYVVMNLYGLLFVFARMGDASYGQSFSFYASVVGLIDYKLFIVVLYLFTKLKGGVLWWLKRKN